MSDSIFRQEAIDAMEQAKEQYFDRRVIIGKMQDIVNNLPSAEPVVYCKYCTHFKSDFWCAWWEGTVSFNDYCSKGEREEKA